MSDDPWLNVFVDETGTNELDSDKPGVSHLFICVAIIVADHDIQSINSALSNISNTLCGSAEIKSNRIGTCDRRLKFLNSIKDLPFGYYALIINKDRIDKPGININEASIKTSMRCFIKGLFLEVELDCAWLSTKSVDATLWKVLKHTWIKKVSLICFVIETRGSSLSATVPILH